MSRDKASPDIQCREWKGVPENCTNAWKEAFDVPSEGYFVPGYCPVCGAETLRRYYYPGCTQAHEVPGMLLPKPGSSWEWCSSCRSYEHAQALVPGYWCAATLNLDHYILTPVPEVLDQAISTIDSGL